MLQTYEKSWKAKFAFWGFCELRIHGVLRSSTRNKRAERKGFRSLPYFASNWMAALCEIAVVPLLRHISLYMFIVVVAVGVL
jgi:hypothetical protein